MISGSLLCAAVPRPRAAYAQTPAKARRVGLVMTTTPVAASHITAAFAEGLRELGHIEGKNLVLEYRWAEGHPERFPEMVAASCVSGST
jgi:putative ABC transport system substrate-binding protein